MLNYIFQKYKLLITVTLLLSSGFIIASFFSYRIAVDLTKDQLKYNSLPLSSDNIYSEIQRDLLKPNLISSLMAQDTFMINWIKNGEKDVNQISSYLAAIKKKYNTSSSFLVSDKSKNYYYSEGILKTIRPSNKIDEWFYRVKNVVDVYESNIDLDLAAENSMTIFTNYRVEDDKGNFLAAVGVGLQTQHVSELLKDYKNKYNHDIYFINKDNKVLLSSNNIEELNKKDTNYINTLINNFNNINKTTQEYTKNDKDYIVNIRFIDELDLYLCVEAQENTYKKEIENALYLNIFMFLIIVITIMILIIYYINNNHNRLQKFANSDELTSLNNRNSFDKAFKTIFNKKDKNLSLLIFDIDKFKPINDKYGHLLGDKVLIRVSELFKKTFREHDLIARWGGDEFVALLPNLDKQTAYKLAERLRSKIEKDKGLKELLDRQITISMGIATRSTETSTEELFSIADKNLYQAKREGRNKIIY